jgi:hypothetical protein
MGRERRARPAVRGSLQRADLEWLMIDATVIHGYRTDRRRDVAVARSSKPDGPDPRAGRSAFRPARVAIESTSTYDKTPEQQVPFCGGLMPQQLSNAVEDTCEYRLFRLLSENQQQGS